MVALALQHLTAFKSILGALELFAGSRVHLVIPLLSALQMLSIWQSRERLPRDCTLAALQQLANLKINYDGILAANRPVQHGWAAVRHLPTCFVTNPCCWSRRARST